MHRAHWLLVYNKQSLDECSHLAMQDMSGQIIWKNHDSEQSIAEKMERKFVC